MGGVIGDVLPLAVGVAISPLPIIAVILMLLAPRAGAASSGFLTGWIAGIVVGTITVTVIADVAGRSTSGGGSTAGATGLGFALAAVKSRLISNNATVVMTLFLVIGIVLIGKGIGTP